MSKNGGIFPGGEKTSHANGGIDYVVEQTAKPVNIEGDEFAFCGDVVESEKEHHVKGTPYHIILDLTKKYNCKTGPVTKVEGEEFIICKRVVRSDQEYSLTGTPQEIINYLQSTGGCNTDRSTGMADAKKLAKGGPISSTLADGTNGQNPTINKNIDGLVADLHQKYLRHRTETAERLLANKTGLQQQLETKLRSGISEKEKADAIMKAHSEIAKNEINIKREIKRYAIAEQELYGARQQVIDWAIDPQNNVTIIVAFSGGKDSVACVLHLLDLGFGRDQIELWHHDVDGGGEDLFDWKCTKSYCKAFARAFGIKILFSYAGGGITREIFRKNETLQPTYFQKEMDGEYHKVTPAPMRTTDVDGNEISPERLAEKNTRYKFPSVSADLSSRWCSAVAKIDTMAKAINNSERFKTANMVVVSGERRAESTARSLYLEIEKYRSFSKTRRAISWKGIVGWTEQQVWDIMKRYKVQPHPCYELGWSRCSCQLCIFGSANTWASVNELSPEKVTRIAEIEAEIGHTLYNEDEKMAVSSGNDNVIYKKTGKKLNVIGARASRGTSFLKQEAVSRWAKEANSEFTSPIFVDEWKMPAGAFNNENCGAN